MLTLIAVAAVVGGVLLLRGGDPDAEAGAEAPPLSLPPLPNTSIPDDTAADFSVDLFDGSRFVLSAHLRDDGRPVLLNLWASWCFPCREEMPDLEEASRNHPEVLIVGVAVDDDPIAAEEFATEIGITYPIGADEADRVSRSYPAVGLPATFLISSDGKILDVIYGLMTSDQIESVIARLAG
jgi:thiol-disulfide isomerase/thioredoxin